MIGWIELPASRFVGIVATAWPGGGVDGNSDTLPPTGAPGFAAGVFKPDWASHAATAKASRIASQHLLGANLRRRCSLPHGHRRRRTAKKLRCDVEFPRGLGGLVVGLPGRIIHGRGGSQRALGETMKRAGEVLVALGFIAAVGAASAAEPAPVSVAQLAGNTLSAVAFVARGPGMPGGNGPT